MGWRCFSDDIQLFGVSCHDTLLVHWYLTDIA